MFSEYAPIVPYTSMGNIALGSDINEVLAALERDSVEYTEIYIPPGVSNTNLPSKPLPFWDRYGIIKEKPGGKIICHLHTNSVDHK